MVEERVSEPGEVERNGVEQLTFHQPHSQPVATLNKVWAKVANGFVVAMAKTGLTDVHPFTDDEPIEDQAGAADTSGTFKKRDERRFSVLDVSGAECGIGYMVDAKGNVAPSNGRETPLMAHEPAYHDRSNPLAPHSIDRAAHMSTGEPRYAADDKVRELGQDTRVEQSDEDKKAVAERSARPQSDVKGDKGDKGAE